MEIPKSKMTFQWINESGNVSSTTQKANGSIAVTLPILIKKMKDMKCYTLILIIIIFNTISCKAQQVFPINIDYEQVPNGSYLKDLNNELNPYVGTYKANYQGNEITLFITKQENKNEKRPLNKQFYRDALVVKYIVKNPLNIVLQDTYNNNLPHIELYSYRIRSIQNTVIFFYSGTNCGVGWGDIYLKKVNSAQISWEYRPEDTVLTSIGCPGNPDIKIYLPETKDLIFTKQ